MNSTSQPDLHPGAESLNAFVEQVLAEPERERILGHLASCSRCRQVVYLAQQAVSGAETPASAATPTFRPARLRTSWRFVWVPAAAMAAIVTLAIILHRPHPVPNSELARVAPQTEEAVPKPSSQKAPGTGTAQSQVAANLSVQKALSAPVRAPARTLAPETNPAALPAAAGAMEPPDAKRQAAAMPPGASEERLSGREALEQFKPEPADAAHQAQFASGSLAGNAPAARITQARMKSTASLPLASRSLTVTASAPQVEMKAAPIDGVGVMAKPSLGTNRIPVIRMPDTTILPGGQIAVSTATARKRTLAIDPAGALFLSEDSGRHWESVVRQWTGRAVEVRVKPVRNLPLAASASGEAAWHGTSQPVSGKPAPASPPAAVFEIVNDSGQTWSSADGKTWKAN
jgi:hypothetical protein